MFNFPSRQFKVRTRVIDSSDKGFRHQIVGALRLEAFSTFRSGCETFGFSKTTKKKYVCFIEINYYLSTATGDSSFICRANSVLKLGFRLALSKVILLNIDCGDKNALSLLIFPFSHRSFTILKNRKTFSPGSRQKQQK